MTTNSQKPIQPIIIPSYEEEYTENKPFLNRFPFLKKRKKTLDTTEKKKQVLRTTTDLLPFIAIEENYIELKEGFMDILQITSKDLRSLNESDLQVILLADTRFYRSYSTNSKVMALNFPANTEKQKRYWERKKANTTDGLKLRFIERKLFELSFLEKERTNREFFLFIYGQTIHSLEDEKNQVIRAMRQSFPLQELSIDKKQDVLFMLNNQNTKL